MSDDMCLDAARPEGPVKIVRCHGMGGNQAWVYNETVCFYNSIINLVAFKQHSEEQLNHPFLFFFFFSQTKMIRHTNTGNCLQKPTNSDASHPVLAKCDVKNLGQKWIMKSKFKWQAS